MMYTQDTPLCGFNVFGTPGARVTVHNERVTVVQATLKACIYILFASESRIYTQTHTQTDTYTIQYSTITFANDLLYVLCSGCLHATRDLGYSVMYLYITINNFSFSISSHFHGIS